MYERERERERDRESPQDSVEEKYATPFGLGLG